MNAPKSRGITSVAIQNALVRTRSTYSRRAMAKTFLKFIPASLHRPGLFHPCLADRVNVDLLEVRLLLRKGLDRVEVERALQEIALVDAGLERHNGLSVLGLRRGDAREGVDVGQAGVDRHAKESLGVAPLQILDRAFEDLFRAGHEDDLVAELLGLLEDVRAKDDRLSAPAKLE